MERIAQLHAFDTLAQLVIVTAYEDELCIKLGGFDPFRDSCHLARSVTAEHHDAGGQIGFQSQPDSLCFTVHLDRSIEIGADDHSRGAKYALARMTHRKSLRGRGFGAANQ